MSYGVNSCLVRVTGAGKKVKLGTQNGQHCQMQVNHAESCLNVIADKSVGKSANAITLVCNVLISVRVVTNAHSEPCKNCEIS